MCADFAFPDQEGPDVGRPSAARPNLASTAAGCPLMGRTRRDNVTLRLWSADGRPLSSDQEGRLEAPARPLVSKASSRRPARPPGGSTGDAPDPRLRSLADYSLLGRSGLRVSPLCLGTMTFGTECGWGADAEGSRAMFRRYVEAGGNFVDTADGCTNGRSEELVGQFSREMGNRDRLVLATKFTFNAVPGDPNAGGSGRKNIHRALEGSLRRLQTDCLDLYWLHAWDGLTPVEEVLSTLDALVRQGKVRHVGFSDTPAWYLAHAQGLAWWRGFEPP